MIALKVILFTIVVPGTVTVLLPSLLLTWTQPFIDLGPLRYIGVVLIVLGAMIYLQCAWNFANSGKGTPAPMDPPKELVVKGLYRYVRNPMYVGVLTVLFGEALFFESLVLFAYGAVIWTMFELFIVLYEEPTLRRIFGESYERYCGSVGRWLPRWPRR